MDSNQITISSNSNYWTKRNSNNKWPFEDVLYLNGKITGRKLIKAFKELLDSISGMPEKEYLILSFDFARFDFKWDGLKGVAADLFNIFKSRNDIKLLCTSRNSNEHLLLLLLKFELAHYHCNNFLVFGSESDCYEYLDSKAGK